MVWNTFPVNKKFMHVFSQTKCIVLLQNKTASVFKEQQYKQHSYLYMHTLMKEQQSKGMFNWSTNYTN